MQTIIKDTNNALSVATIATTSKHASHSAAPLLGTVKAGAGEISQTERQQISDTVIIRDRDGATPAVFFAVVTAKPFAVFFSPMTSESAAAWFLGRFDGDGKYVSDENYPTDAMHDGDLLYMAQCNGQDPIAVEKAKADAIALADSPSGRSVRRQGRDQCYQDYAQCSERFHGMSIWTLGRLTSKTGRQTRRSARYFGYFTLPNGGTNGGKQVQE